MLKLKSFKSLALIGVIALVLPLQACSSIESKVEKACSLVDRASEMLKAEDDSYTSVYSEAADILQKLADDDEKYDGPYQAALLWASGNDLAVEDLSILIELEELCTPSEE